MSAINPHTGRPYEESPPEGAESPKPSESPPAGPRPQDPGPAGEVSEGDSPAAAPVPSRESGPSGPAGPAEEVGPPTQALGTAGAGAAFAADTAAGTSTAADSSGGATMSQQELAIRSALETVMDPEIGLSVIDLGLIREIHVLEGRTLVRMMLTTPFCPYAPQMMEDVKGATMSAVPQPCEVEILPDAWSPDMMPDPGLLGFSF
jgi:metal-sulfur cluster biosynthetic enzyme